MRTAFVQYRLSQFLMALALVLFVCLAGRASAQALPYDGSIDQLVDAGLVTILDETLEHDGVQVTVQFAYADIQRLIARVKFSGDYEELLQDHMHNFVLRDAAGHSFSYNSALPVLREDDELAEIYDVSFYGQTTFTDEDGNFLISEDYLTTIGDSIDLTLSVSFSDMSALAMVMEAAATDETSGVGPFDFNFTVPVYPATSVMPAETQTTGDIAMTLDRITIAPSQTEIALCYTLPDATDWQPVATVTLGDTTAQASGASLVGTPTVEDTERCVEQRFDVFGAGVQTLIVTVERLQTSVPDDPEAWAGFAEALGAFGVGAEAFAEPHTYFTILSTPEGMTDAELAEIINDAREDLRQKVDGPWVFEVALP